MAKKKIDFPVYRSDANNPPDDMPEQRRDSPAPETVAPVESHAAAKKKARDADRIRREAEKKLSDERKREIQDAKTLTPDMRKSMTDPRETME